MTDLSLSIESRLKVIGWLRETNHVSGIPRDQLRKLKLGALDNIPHKMTAALFDYVWLGIVTTGGAKL